MKLLTLNFLTCAVRTCKSAPQLSFPLHVRDAELELIELEFNAEFLTNILPRIEWPALRSVANEVGLSVPAVFGRDESETMDIDEGASSEISEEDLRKLHRVLLETQIASGMLVCGNCAHEYKILEGIPNFLLPPHLV